MHSLSQVSFSTFHFLKWGYNLPIQNIFLTRAIVRS